MNEWTEFHARHSDKIELVAGIDCWIWTGCSHPGGHGRISSSQGHNYAHRAAYEAFTGEPPGDMMVRHICGCAGCVRPSHLKTGTAADNAKDTADMQRTPSSLSHEDVRLLRRMYDEGIKLKDIADHFGIAFGSVYPIVCYKSFLHVDPERKGQHVRRVKNFVSDKQIKEARRLILEGVRVVEISRLVGINQSAVSNIKTGARYADR